MKNKILLVIHTPPPFGGGEIQAQTLKDFFHNNNYIYIYDYARKNHKREDWNKIRIHVIFHGIYWIVKVCFLLIKLRPRKICITLPKSFFGFIRNAMVFPLARLLKTKIFGELPGSSFLFLDKKNSIHYMIGIHFLRQVDEIRFLSKRIAENHAKYNLKCAKVIENGVSIPQGIIINPSIFDKQVLPLVYIGSIERSKGIFNTLGALKICKDKGVQVHLNIIGHWIKREEESEALAFIKTHLLEKNVTFHGVKKDMDKWNLFKSNAVLVYPTYWDGVPLSILEAIGIGIPVISTHIGGIPDTIKEQYNGLLLEENNAEKLFQAIEYLNNNRILLKEMSKNNIRDFKERFDLPIFLRNMNDWFLS